MVIVISFTHKRKTVPNDYAPEFLTRIVQSPTKLNDKISLTKNNEYQKKLFLNNNDREMVKEEYSKKNILGGQWKGK